MIVEVCGMTDAENISKTVDSGADWIGFDFRKGSPKFIKLLPSKTGIIPDTPSKQLAMRTEPVRVGVFRNTMPQSVITLVYNYNIDVLQFEGEENPILLSNLRATIDPDIRKRIKIVKSVAVNGPESFSKCPAYYGCVDYFLFSFDDSVSKQWELLDGYRGDIPFLLKDRIGHDDSEAISRITHPLFAGVSIDDEFEVSCGIKDPALTASFIAKIK